MTVVCKMNEDEQRKRYAGEAWLFYGEQTY